jgi:Zn finger protein HypA/HybF involved in hydrogenase expression
MVLDTNPTSAVGPGESQSGQLTIASWPDSKVVEVEIIWMTSGQIESGLLEIVSYADAESGAELPFDLSAAIYGAISGLVLVMFILVLYRTVSESVADTGTSRFNRLREARGERKKAAAATKREIPCPECDQRLSIPSTHAGAVKCPACTARFSVDAVADDTTIPTTGPSSEMSQMPSPPSAPVPEPTPEQPLDAVARSMVDFLSCPSCAQTLKVPVERRPVKARCPACRSEFIAEVGQE